MQSSVYHIPALLDACMAGLAVQPDGTYVDVTFGGGGHSRAILERLGDKGRLYAFDQDEDACVNRIEDNRFTFVRSNFRFLKNFMRYYDVDSIDGLLADLGVSFHHFDASERGFSFRFDGALDMRSRSCRLISTNGRRKKNWRSCFRHCASRSIKRWKLCVACCCRHVSWCGLVVG